MNFQVRFNDEQPARVEVECPLCHARPGVLCRSVVDGRVLNFVHVERLVARTCVMHSSGVSARAAP